MTDDARFWSWAIVSALLIGLWAVESGRVGLLKTVLTTPDKGFAVGAQYQNGQQQSSSSGSGLGAALGIGGTLGDLLGGAGGGLFG